MLESTAEVPDRQVAKTGKSDLPADSSCIGPEITSSLRHEIKRL